MTTRVEKATRLPEGACTLKQSVAEMRAGFREDRARTAKKARNERMAFVKGLKRDVTALKEAGTEAQADFRRTHSETVTRARIDRKRFVSGLRRGARDRQQEVEVALDVARKARPRGPATGPKATGMPRAAAKAPRKSRPRKKK